MSAPYTFRRTPWRPTPPRPPPRAWDWFLWALLAGFGAGCWWRAAAADWHNLGAGLAAGLLLMDLYHRLVR